MSESTTLVEQHPRAPQMSTGARGRSLSVFFPCYNDGGTIGSMVILAYDVLRRVTDDYEVIVVNDCSHDSSAQVLKELQRFYPDLRVVTHERNRGYGGALRAGFAHATKDWVFYTDGDAQYNPGELTILLNALRPGVDMVNGYKITRSDPFYRIVIGKLYHWAACLAFGLRIRDVDCDFRLIHRAIFETVHLESDSGVICVEMMKKIQDAGYRIAEVPIHHYHRVYAGSQFFRLNRIVAALIGFSRLWWRMRMASLVARRPSKVLSP